MGTLKNKEIFKKTIMKLSIRKIMGAIACVAIVMLLNAIAS